MRIPQRENCAPEFHTFWPLTIHSSPSRSALVCRPARSEPAPGSENSWHHTSLPLTMLGRNRWHCSSVPWSMMVGPAIITPMPLGGPTAPTAARAAPTCLAWSLESPLPNQRLGQVGYPQPLSVRRSHHLPSVSSGSPPPRHQPPPSPPPPVGP